MKTRRKTEAPGEAPRTWAEAHRQARETREQMTPEEDAALTAAAESDPDNPPLDDATLAALRPARPRGRPKSERPKVAVKLRLDPDVVDKMKEGGPGWQTRANAALRKAYGLK